ncbi:hypothetical protein [Burkholderia sp. L27(2015)]|uniref:hypothetical protein n=1 Tax=Burkholderia sp. L27(2015) TaxID=1641858 RepID=UPI00131D64AE|nr:hypothetical protein [Burkholderia sp. L27(2015)]
MQCHSIAKSIGRESLTFSPNASFAVHPKPPGTEPPDEDAQEEDSEPGEPPEPVQTPKNPGDA